jgi:hypothetical protein
MLLQKKGRKMPLCILSVHPIQPLSYSNRGFKTPCYKAGGWTSTKGLKL